VGRFGGSRESLPRARRRTSSRRAVDRGGSPLSRSGHARRRSVSVPRQVARDGSSVVGSSPSRRRGRPRARRIGAGQTRSVGRPRSARRRRHSDGPRAGIERRRTARRRRPRRWRCGARPARLRASRSGRRLRRSPGDGARSRLGARAVRNSTAVRPHLSHLRLESSRPRRSAAPVAHGEGASRRASHAMRASSPRRTSDACRRSRNAALGLGTLVPRRRRVHSRDFDARRDVRRGSRSARRGRRSPGGAATGRFGARRAGC